MRKQVVPVGHYEKLLQKIENNPADVDAYQVTISALSVEDGGGFLAEVFELPGCMADGETKEEALRNISDAIVSGIETAKAEGRTIPAPKLAVAV